MPNLDVCTGPAFATGPSGELVVAGSNNGTWPLAGPIAANNGLNTDPANGLWTAPHGCYSQLQEQSGSGLTAAIPYSMPTTLFNFTNPSSVMRMRVIVQVQSWFQFNIVAGGVVMMNGGADVGIAPSTSAAMPVANPTGGTLPLQASVHMFTEVILAPGAVASMSAGAGANYLGGNTGSVVTAWYCSALFQGWLLDPTQAGGIS